MTEVFFPNRFTVDKHSGKAPDMFPNYPEELNGISVPIECLTHVTHDKEASEIRQDSHFEFKARKKFGKTREWDGRSCGDSFRPSQVSVGYFQITDRDAVFPGYYSWWSVHLKHTPLPHGIQGGLDRIKEEQRFTTFVPDYLNVNPHSRYGNHSFVCNFEHLLTAYANARGIGIGNVCIRKGGTLRYELEICYVLIVCTDNDEDRRELADFDPLQLKSPEFQTNGLIRADGSLENPAAIATFYPRCIISWAKHILSDNPDRYSYENVAFAFYFPEDGSSMVVDRCATNEVGHKSCIKTQPTKLGGWKCPN